jgi:hypothetical protein
LEFLVSLVLTAILVAIFFSTTVAANNRVLLNNADQLQQWG